MKKMNLRPLAASASVLLLLFASCVKVQESAKTQVQSTISDANKGSGYIITPEGPMLASDVHLIENGSHLNIANGHVFKIESATGRTIADFGELRPANGYKLRMPNRSLQQGATVDNGSGIQPPGTNPGWIVWSQWSSGGGPITSLSTSWVIPAGPTNITDNQLIYIFNGLSDAAGDNIMQPVLQWGSNNLFGVQKWVIANWYVWPGGSAVSYPDSIGITAGTTLTGVLTDNGFVNGSYNYTSSFTGYPANNTLTITYTNTNNYYHTGPIPIVPIETIADETLEAYHPNSNYPGVVQSADYPSFSAVGMSNITAQVNGTAVTPSWTTHSGPYALFGERILPNPYGSGNEVDIYFRQPPTPTITSLGERPGGGAIGNVIVYFSYPSSGYYSFVPWYNARVTNNRTGAQLNTTNNYGSSPLFLNTPTGTVKGDNISVSIQAVFSGSITTTYSNTMNITL